ncbi:hypothetical protein Q0590_09470 [Rhodocytophaga aerolata]|uniref:Uncharacterized protein n=1 Tax=Rhodocytophaga aerolata TaxID=455078 RepID=A0ABT8R2Z9_9BACT|nr:hypothetical protein [Rhodocytophaga aerolata]MDO1446477.1 hypothetical protein [Rhodocytophaga aerolata]
MAQNGSYAVASNAIKMTAVQMHTKMMYYLAYTNQLQEAPVDPNRVYVVDGKKYGQPRFRIKRRSGGDVLPDSDAFWFTKEENTEKITLHCIIEVYRDEADVYPLSIRNSQISLEYEAAGKEIQKPLAITQSPMMNEINILQDLHAETEIAWDEIKDLLIELKDPSKSATFQLVVTSEMWWQKPAASPQTSTVETPPIVVMPVMFSAVITDTVAKQAEAEPKVKVATAFSANIADSVRIMDARIVRDHRNKDKETGGVVVRDHRNKDKVIIRDHRDRVVEDVKVDNTPPAPEPPQKIDLRHVIVRQYTKQDQAVFGPLSAEFEDPALKWEVVNLVKENVPYTIYYRPTTQPDDFYFLPQSFRIKAKEHNGEPKISISMLAGEDPNKPEMYRINIGITLIPYYNPKAKKDLYRTLDSLSKGTIKFCKLRLGGYKSAQFKLKEAFAGENAVFRGKIQETISSIDPVNGFTLMVDCSLESFDFFKREITDGQWIIGDIVFELISDKGGQEQISLASIPVELDIRKLAGIPVAIDSVVEKTEDDEVAIKGFKINNTNTFPITVNGAELMLLSKIGSTVYDADYEIGVQRSWPVAVDKQAAEEVLLKTEDIADIADRFWTELICEPHGVSLNTSPDEVLGKVIDYATGDPQVWRLEVSCPLFERWTQLDEATLAPFQQVHLVSVEIKNEDGSVFSVQLDKNKPVASIEMARSITQILKSQQLSSRKYQYRVGTVYVVNPTHWTDWLNPESTAANYLSVIPQKLTS